MSINNWNGFGRLTADVDLRYTANGTAVANFTIAVDENYSKDGEIETQFVDITAWRGLGEMLAEKIGKGCRVNVSGRLKFNKWEDDEGRKRKDAYIQLKDIDIIDWKDDKQDNKQDNKQDDSSDNLDVPF